MGTPDHPAGPAPWFTSPRRAIEAAGVAALTLLIFALAYAPLLDQDIWWHLKAGWYILSHGGVPRRNVFLYTTDAPWIDLHWLFQVTAYETWALLGPDGMIGLKVTLVLAAWALLARIATPPGRFLAMLPFLSLGAIASNERMTDRPELFSYLFLALEIALLLRWRRRPSAGPLFAVVGVQALWGNFHSLSVIGLAVILAFLAGEWCTGVLSRRGRPTGDGVILSSGDLARLALACAGCFAALAATPYGVAGARHRLTLFLLLQNPKNAIAEFMSPFPAVHFTSWPSFDVSVVPTFYPTAAVHAFWILSGAVAAACLLSFPRLNLSLLLATLGLFAAAAASRRNIQFFVFAALPFLGAQLGVVSARLRRFRGAHAAARPIGPLLATCLIVLLVFLARDVVRGRFYARDGLSKRFGRGVEEQLIPRGAMDYVIKKGLSGNAFNDLDSGGYFSWRAFPARRAFIDAGLDSMPQSLLDTYSRAFYVPNGWRGLDAHYHFDYAILLHTASVNLRMIRQIQADPDWALVHLDPSGLVYVRRASVPTALLARDEIGPGRNAPPAWRANPAPADSIARAVRRLLGAESPPATADALAYATILIQLGFAKDAAAPVDAALAADPRSARAWMLRGALADALGDLPRARTAFEEASRLDPRSMEAAFNLGSVRLRSGDTAGAVAPLERAIRLRPSFAEAHAFLGVARLASGDATGAEGPLRRALALDPTLADPVYYLGVAARQRGDVAAAARLFAEFLRRPGGNPILRDDAGRSPGVTK